MKGYILLATLALAWTRVTSSAIPMWEFLSRGEKMSHLFNMFVKQVADHCHSSTMPDCQKVLLVYGLTNLAKMEDDSLDKMDPYQRGANDIIWESMMGGNYDKNYKNEAHHEKEHFDDSLEDSVSEGGNSLNWEGASSSTIEQYAGPTRYVVGPMVVRVMPDGRPVPNQDPLPKDEDREQFVVGPLPSLADIQYGRVPRR